MGHGSIHSAIRVGYLWSIHIDTNEVSSQSNCSEKNVFMETTSSPYWSLRSIRESYSADSPYMRMHRRFHDEARAAALSVVGLDENTASSSSMGNDPPKICYMLRKLRPKRKRHFSRSFEVYRQPT